MEWTMKGIIKGGRKRKNRAQGKALVFAKRKKGKRQLVFWCSIIGVSLVTSSTRGVWVCFISRAALRSLFVHKRQQCWSGEKGKYYCISDITRYDAGLRTSELDLSHDDLEGDGILRVH